MQNYRVTDEIFMKFAVQTDGLDAVADRHVYEEWKSIQNINQQRHECVMNCIYQLYL